MHIRDIRIRNIRSLRSHRWSFAPTKCAGWHVLLGDNGSGKSSFLRSIALGLIGAGRADWLRQSWSDWLTRDKREGEIRLMLQANEPDVISTRPRLDGSMPNDKIFQTGIRLGRGQKSSDVAAIEQVRGGTPSQESLAQVLSLEQWPISTEWFSVSFGPFRRFSGGANGQSGLPPMLVRHLSLFDEGMAFTECLDWLQDLRFRTLEDDPEGRSAGSRLKRFVNETGFLPSGVRIKEVTSRNVMFRDANGAKCAHHET